MSKELISLLLFFLFKIEALKTPTNAMMFKTRDDGSMDEVEDWGLDRFVSTDV